MRLTTLMLLIKVSATVTVYRGHRRTLFFLLGIISLFIMCIGIIWNNSLVGGCAWAGVWTPVLEHMAPEFFDHWTTWAGQVNSVSLWIFMLYRLSILYRVPLSGCEYIWLWWYDVWQRGKPGSCKHVCCWIVVHTALLLHRYSAKYPCMSLVERTWRNIGGRWVVAMKNIYEYPEVQVSLINLWPYGRNLICKLLWLLLLQLVVDDDTFKLLTVSVFMVSRLCFLDVVLSAVCATLAEWIIAHWYYHK